jgi:Protein of unknown function (DUF4079)
MMRLSFWSVAAAAVAAAATGTSAFAPSSTATRRAVVSISAPSSFATPAIVRQTTSMLHMQKSPQPIEDSLDATLVTPEVPFPIPSMGLTASMMTLLLSFPLSASAAGPDWGIFEGRIGSLLHPITMGSLLLYSLYTAYLGFQWRRQRTIGDEIAALKSKLPATSTSAELGAVAAVVAETRETNLIEAQINALTRERKEIAAKGPRDQHFSQGAFLACIGTLFAIEVRECVQNKSNMCGYGYTAWR